jgi:hypothetical protein
MAILLAVNYSAFPPFCISFSPNRETKRKANLAVAFAYSTEEWPKEKAFPLGKKMIRAVSTPHKVQSSLAFLKSPDRRFEKKTCRAFNKKLRAPV